jgi:benzoyl-CoA reductase/2-hydroxyglutaryl-CoA dehydratase subunit BcrC/BadD/HgdB
MNTNFSKTLAATWKPWMPDGWHWSKYHNKDQQISDAMEKNLGSLVAIRVGFVHSTVLPYCKRSNFTTTQNTCKISLASFHSIENVIFIMALCQEFSVSLH